MIVELSNLRALGFLLGLAMFVGIFFELRRHRSRRLSRAPFMVFSLLVMVVAAYPSTVNLPARFLGLDGISGGRLLALLLVSAILVWPVAIRNRSRLADMQRDLMATIRQFALLDFRSTYGEAVPRDAVWVVRGLPEPASPSHTSSVRSTSSSGPNAWTLTSTRTMSSTSGSNGETLSPSGKTARLNVPSASDNRAMLPATTRPAPPSCDGTIVSSVSVNVW